MVYAEEHERLFHFCSTFLLRFYLVIYLLLEENMYTLVIHSQFQSMLTLRVTSIILHTTI